MSDDPKQAAASHADAAETRVTSRPPRSVARGAGWGFAVATTLGAAQAAATDAEVTSDSSAQMYDVRSPTGEVVLSRQRYDATLGINATNLTNAAIGDARAPVVSLRVRLRYGADFGLSSATFNASQANDFVPGRQAAMVDVMFAYLEGRRLLGGPLGFRLGRQYVTDVLGWWSFDGAELNATTPFFLRAEVYGGFEQRGNLALGTSRFEADGVWRGSRDGLLPTQYPSFQSASPAPALGVGIESTGVRWLHARVTARRVYDTGPSNVAPFGAGPTSTSTVDGMRVSSDRLGGSINVSLWSVGAAQSGFVYDFYRGDITHLYGALDGHLHPRLTVGVDYDYFVPSFDADSIWNFFGIRSQERHRSTGRRIASRAPFRRGQRQAASVDRACLEARSRRSVRSRGRCPDKRPSLRRGIHGVRSMAFGLVGSRLARRRRLRRRGR